MSREQRSGCVVLVLSALLMSTTATAGRVIWSEPGLGQFSASVTSLKELRFKSTVHQKYDYSCGSAAVATLLTYQFGDPVSESDVFSAMWKHGDKKAIRKEGFSMWDMKTYLDARGYKANGYTVPLERLQKAGLPAIALVRENGYAHFVVIKGLRPHQVLVGDPALGTRILSRKAFEASWYVRILLVVTNEASRAIFNLSSDWQIRPKAPLAAARAPDNLLTTTLIRPNPLN